MEKLAPQLERLLKQAKELTRNNDSTTAFRGLCFKVSPCIIGKIMVTLLMCLVCKYTCAASEGHVQISEMFMI